MQTTCQRRPSLREEESLQVFPLGAVDRHRMVRAGSAPLEEPRGTAGFGFDPVFIPDGEERTVAELGDEWKRAHSHRGRAARALLAAF